MKKSTILIILLFFLILFGFSKEPGKKKFQVEVFAGLSTLNPGDLVGAHRKQWHTDDLLRRSSVRTV